MKPCTETISCTLTPLTAPGKHKAAQSHPKFQGTGSGSVSKLWQNISTPKCLQRQGCGAVPTSESSAQQTPLGISLLSPGEFSPAAGYLLHSKFTRSRHEDSATPECRNPCWVFAPLQLHLLRQQKPQCLPSCHSISSSIHQLFQPCSVSRTNTWGRLEASVLQPAGILEYSVLELTLMLQRLNLKSNPNSRRSVSVGGGSRKCLELAAAPTARGEWTRGSHQQLQCNRTILKVVKSFTAVSPLPPTMNTEQGRTPRLPDSLLSCSHFLPWEHKPCKAPFSSHTCQSLSLSLGSAGCPQAQV